MEMFHSARMHSNGDITHFYCSGEYEATLVAKSGEEQSGLTIITWPDLSQQQLISRLRWLADTLENGTFLSVPARKSDRDAVVCIGPGQTHGMDPDYDIAF